MPETSNEVVEAVCDESRHEAAHPSKQAPPATEVVQDVKHGAGAHQHLAFSCDDEDAVRQEGSLPFRNSLLEGLTLEGSESETSPRFPTVQNETHRAMTESTGSIVKEQIGVIAHPLIMTQMPTPMNAEPAT